MKQLIVGLGEALWDCLPEGRKLGGAPANFAYHAGQFGHDSLAISAVGNDASLAQRSSVSRQTIQKFLETTPKDCLKIFDINLRQNFYTKEVITTSLQHANILKINDEELVTIGRLFGYPGLDIENKCWLLLGKYNLDMLVLTCGVNGSYVFAPNLKSFQETPSVEVADTVGAGDSFTGAFTSAILAGMPLPDAHKLAVDVSAYVCTQNGAMPKLPKKLLDRIK